jgi:hypothetical protein
VFHVILAEDEDVIQIHYHTIIGEIPQDIIHHPHEICWSICQAEGHDQPFKNTFFGLEGKHLYIDLLYWNLVVGRIQINLIEVFSPLELVKDIVSSGNWVSVSNYDFI